MSTKANGTGPTITVVLREQTDGQQAKMLTRVGVYDDDDDDDDEWMTMMMMNALRKVEREREREKQRVCAGKKKKKACKTIAAQRRHFDAFASLLLYIACVCGRAVRQRKRQRRPLLGVGCSLHYSTLEYTHTRINCTKSSLGHRLTLGVRRTLRLTQDKGPR